MAFLAASDVDFSMIPVSGMAYRPELLKHQPPHTGHCEQLARPVEEGFALRMERPLLAGDGFSDWMTECTDLSTLLSVSGEPPPLPLLPSPPAPDLTSLLKKELEQMEGYFLEGLVSPDQVAPSTPPFDMNFNSTFSDGVQLLSHHHIPAPLQTLDSGCLQFLELYGRDTPAELSPQASEDHGPMQGPPTLPPMGDRCQKKRDQNKMAALRYRQRKRAEHDALGDECQALEARNRDLREKAESIEREIQYVKDLLIEVYKARSQRLRTSP